MKFISWKRQITKDDVGRFALFPCSRLDIDEFDSLKSNTRILTETKYFRSPAMVKLFDKYHALCQILAENIRSNTDDEVVFKSKKEADEYLRYKTGLVEYTEIININGENVVRVKTKSIAWASMSADEFELYYNKCVPIVCKLLGCTEDELHNNMIF